MLRSSVKKSVMIGDAVAYAYINKPDMINIRKFREDQASFYESSYIKFRMRCIDHTCQTFENHVKINANFKRKN